MKKIFIIAILLVFLGSCNVEKNEVNTEIKKENTVIINDDKNNIDNIVKEEGIVEKEITPEEEEFNNSGRAKAIEKESNLYDNLEVGISFNYPNDVILLENNMKKDDTKTYIHIDLLDMQLGEGPMRLSKEDEMKNVEALTSGEFGIEQDFPLSASKQVKSVGFLFAQDFLVLGRFDICDVTLERKLLFYFNNKQITITLHGPSSELNKKYLTINEANCGDQLIWNFDKQEDFNTSLMNGKENESIQKWYNLFDKITETVIFSHR